MFIHGRITLNDEEWAGFKEGAGSATKADIHTVMADINLNEVDFDYYI